MVFVAFLVRLHWNLVAHPIGEFMYSDMRGYNNRANALLGQGKVEKAIREYEQALSMNPKSPILKGNLEIAKKRQKGAGERAGKSEG